MEETINPAMLFVHFHDFRNQVSQNIDVRVERSAWTKLKRRRRAESPRVFCVWRRTKLLRGPALRLVENIGLALYYVVKEMTFEVVR